MADVQEIFVSFLVELADDVRVVVGFLEDGDFALGQGDEVAEETFDGNGAALEGALETGESSIEACFMEELVTSLG